MLQLFLTASSVSYVGYTYFLATRTVQINKEVEGAVASLQKSLVQAEIDGHSHRLAAESLGLLQIKMAFEAASSGREFSLTVQAISYGMNNLARALFELDRKVEMVLSKHGHESDLYQEANDQFKAGKSLYWKFAGFLEEMHKYPKKGTWRQDLPPDCHVVDR